jgi:hypothetical protein
MNTVRKAGGKFKSEVITRTFSAISTETLWIFFPIVLSLRGKMVSGDYNSFRP